VLHFDLDESLRPIWDELKQHIGDGELRKALRREVLNCAGRSRTTPFGAMKNWRPLAPRFTFAILSKSV
jgi:hypothetical protein